MERTFAEICEEARQKSAELDKAAAKEEKEQKGLKFMAYQMNVAKKHLELSIKKEVTPAESNLLRLLELGTIGAQNYRSQITSKAEFCIDDLSRMLGYKTKMKIWSILKSLETKKFIIREKTRSKNIEILGLNPEIFGQILIDKHQEIDKKRHLRLVDNSKCDVDNSTNETSEKQIDRMQNTNESYVDDKRSVYESQTERVSFESQDIEIIDEKSPLDSSRFILDSFRGQNQKTNVSKIWNRGINMSPEEAKAEAERQINAARKAGLI